MKQRVINCIIGILRILFVTLYRKPKNTIKLFFNPELWNHPGYDSNKKNKKGRMRIIFDQIIQIWKYGDANEFYFLYGLDAKYGNEYKSYIHYAPFMKRRDELNLRSIHNSSCILRNKFYFGIFADSIGVDTPHNIAYIQNNILFLIKEKKHITLDEFIKSGNYNLFCKVLDGECGNGIFKLSIQNGVIIYNNEVITIETLKRKIANTNYLLQAYIHQHSEMSRLYNKSINTIRLVTVRSLKDNQITVLPSILRIGANESFVDNTSQGGIAIEFNLDSGKLDKYGYYKPQFGLRASEHPNSHIVFESFYIPYLKQAITQAKSFHSLISDIHSIGWDIAIGENGPIFIEGNDNWEINGHQNYNKGLAKEFYNLFYK